jgi:ribosomal protein S18 acetylase RimI-like enzyme
MVSARGPVTIRRLRAAEWAALRALRLEALREAPGAFGSTYEREVILSDNDWRERAARSGSGVDAVIVVAVVGGRWVGMARGSLDERGDGSVGRPTASMTAVYVAPDWRGRGVGSAVSAGVVEWARERGAAEIRLHVADGNDDARRLYERLGFTLTGRREALARDRSVGMSELRLAL